MGKTKDLGHLAHIVAYDAENHITVPAGITMHTNQLVASQSYVTTALSSYALSSSLSSYVPTSRTITINGTTFDLSANRTFTIAAGLSSFNTRTGDVTLTSSDVTTALGFTPVTNARTITINGTTFDLSADRSYTVSAGTTLNGTGFVKASGTTITYDNSTYLTGITSTLVTNALGFTPYNATNPAGYITGISFANVSSKPTTLSGYGITDALGYISFTDSIGLNDNKLYLRTKGDNNHYIWNAADDWEEIVAYSGTGLRITSSTGVTLATFSTGGNSMNITGNAATSTTFSTGRTNYKGVTDGAVAGQLMWKQYGNSHTIFDASNGTSPDGTTVSRHTPQNPVATSDGGNAWGVNPNLMGWNGSSTFGIKVDWSRYSESTGSVAWTNVSGRPTAVSSFTNDSAYLTSVGIGNMTDVHRLFNNMGQNHGTYQDFNSVGNFGVRYMQGSNNGPQSGQHYGFTLGLGNDYAYGTYGTQFYWLRNTTNPYIWIRYQEAGSWSSWTKAAAGYADTAGSASSANAAAGVSFLTQANPTWGARIQLGGNGGGSGVANIAVVQATDGNLHMDSGVGKGIYLNYYQNGIIYLNGITYSISGNGSYYNGTSASSNALTTNATANNIFNSGWFRNYGDSGLYNQDYGCHIARNSQSSHGSWSMWGYTKAGYVGMNLQDPQGYNNNLMFEQGRGGVYQENGGGWHFYYDRPNDCLGLSGSETYDWVRACTNGKHRITNDTWCDATSWAYTFSNISDGRLKENIVTVDSALDKVLQLRGVYYNWIIDTENKKHIGLIAQETAAVCPEVVNYHDETDTYSVNYSELSGLFVESTKELNQKLMDANARIELLETKLNQLLNA